MITLSLSFFKGYNQKRISVKVDSSYFIGTWQLTKLADKNLKFLKNPVEQEILKFTKDSIFIALVRDKFRGTWSLNGSQANMKINGTDKFKYKWIAGSKNSKFFTTDGLGYYKYFERIE